MNKYEGRDLEGGRTYRVHINVALNLIEEAYKIGVVDGIAASADSAKEVHGG